MKKKHRNNLIKLADYLDGLTEEYQQEHFNMSVFQAQSDHYAEWWENDPGDALGNKLYKCGSCACAVGHGPYAGVRIYKDRTWWDYCRRVFGIEQDDAAFEYMFGVDNPNSAQKAASRIRTYVEKGSV